MRCHRERSATTTRSLFCGCTTTGNFGYTTQHCQQEDNITVFYPSRMTSLTAAVKISQPFSRSACEMFSGGMNLMTSYIEVVRISRPFSMHRLATRAARPFGADKFNAGSPDGYDGDSNSTATINPVPRTSTIVEPTAGSLRRLCNDANSSCDLKERREQNEKKWRKTCTVR